MKHNILAFLASISLMLVSAQVTGQDARPDKTGVPAEEEPLPAIADLTADLDPKDGFQLWYRDVPKGKVWLLIDDWDREFLFSWGLSTGLGSNPIGLDRGQLGDQFVCRFRRVGRKVFLVARNLNFRALSNSAVEQQAVTESFAESILWGGTVSAETDDSVLVDATGLLTSDLHGIARRLKLTEQGEYQLDQTRCGVFFPRCKSFPKNTELESTLTFTGQEPGDLVSQVTPVPASITLRQHVSFVELPDENYRPRAWHPRCASMFIQFSDYAVPIDKSLQRRWILRHRLQKQDPAAELSPPVEPIVYYVDPGAPPQIRQALIDGARWWNEAFTAAGFEDAFLVKMLPDDADPMDVRFNVIQWVHRSTRGWSYGGSVIDPRTGEIIKGHVTLGSLRVRQDRLIFDGLPQVAQASSGANRSACACCGMIGVAEDTTLARLDEAIDPVDVALARIRQLSAHEVGHTLGLVHNFAASTWGDRASVMDYPAPRIGINEDRTLDLSDAYGTGVGAWDNWSIEYAYRQFPDDAEEGAQLGALVRLANTQAMTFVTDADARPASAAHPYGNLWDNGSDPVEELRHVMKVRRIALQRLSPEDLRPEEPMSNFEQLLVPLYLHHRFQVAATAKLIGGVEYSYDVAANARPMKRVGQTMQLQAVQALLETLGSEQLAIGDGLWRHLTPSPNSNYRDVERFSGSTAPVFDRETAARIAADLTVSNLLEPQRVSRLEMLQPSSDSLGARQMIAALVDYAWRQPTSTMAGADVSRIVRDSVVDHLIRLAASDQASLNAKTAANFGIDRVRQYVSDKRRSANANERTFAELILARIDRFQSRSWPDISPGQPISPPPGSPIGN